MDIKFFLPARYNSETKRFETEMYTNLAQNVYMNINEDETVFEAIKSLNETVQDIKNNTGLEETIGTLPVGTILPWLATSAPTGWLPLDIGALISRETYPDLWEWVQESGMLISEAEWQLQAAAQDSVGYYSDGDGESTFRLPRIVDFIRGSGKDREPGSFQGDAIRNITGNLGRIVYNYDWSSVVSGVFKVDSSYRKTATSDNSSGAWSEYIHTFDASRVVPTSTENRPKNIAMLYCVKAFDAPVNEGLIDISELANEVVDKPFRNEISALASGAGMPSSRYIDFALPASGGTYTAPADGWLSIGKVTGVANAYLTVANMAATVSTTGPGSVNNLCIYIPLKKGAMATISYSATGTTSRCRFTYAEGAE